MKNLDTTQNTPNLLVLKSKRQWLWLPLFALLPLGCAFFYLSDAADDLLTNICFGFGLLVFALPMIAYVAQKTVLAIDSADQIIAFGHSALGQWFNAHEFRFEQVSALVVEKGFRHSSRVLLELQNGKSFPLFGSYPHSEASGFANVLAERLNKPVETRNISNPRLKRTSMIALGFAGLFSLFVRLLSPSLEITLCAAFIWIGAGALFVFDYLLTPARER